MIIEQFELHTSLSFVIIEAYASTPLLEASANHHGHNPHGSTYPVRTRVSVSVRLNSPRPHARCRLRSIDSSISVI